VDRYGDNQAKAAAGVFAAWLIFLFCFLVALL
jgi:hypothetical protein